MAIKKPLNKINKKIENPEKETTLEKVMEDNKLLNEIEETMEDFEDNLDLLKDAIVGETEEDVNTEKDFEPIINNFYDSINIPYCKRCGEKELVGSNGEKVCAISYEKCTYIKN